MSRGFASNYRILLVAIGLFACFASLGARLVCLHVLDRDELLKSIVKTRRQDTRDTARRGDILDRSGAILATTRAVNVLAVDPMLVRPEDEAKLPQLAALLELPLDEVRRLFTTKYRTVTVDRKGPGVSLALGKPATNQPAAAPATAAAATAMPTVKFEIPRVNPSTAARDAGTSGDPLPDPDFGREMIANNEAPGAAVDPAATDSASKDEAEATTAQRAIRWAKLSDHVSDSTYAEIEKLGIKALCPPERRFARYYPHNELASHLIGFANRENHGVAGIEAYTDFYLRGQDGWREGEKDGRRRELAQFQTRSIPRADGYSVILTLDATVQDIVEQELDKLAKTYAPKKATIIVTDPRTGFILGMANYPTFDPNAYNLVPKEEMARMKNVAVSDVYEPGSVFKIVAASAALEDGLVTPETRFDCTTDHVLYKGREYSLNEDHHFDHPLSVAEIIAKSSNRGAAQLAIKVGDARFEQYARRFGFGQTLGFPVGGEVPGIFRPHDKWYPIDMTRIPMGHSIAATALQMHMAMSTIANGGVLLRPQIIAEIRDTSKAIVYQYGRAEIGRAVSERTARTVAQMLQGVASVNGTAPEAAIKINGLDYEVAGKTGTAQKYLPEVMPSGRTKLMPSKKHHVVSFVGFFPASRPQVAISVIVDDADARAPNGVAYGSKVAAPVFKTIGEKLIPILGITPSTQRPLDILAAAEGGHR